MATGIVSRLVIDFGNTRLKWRLGDAETLVARGALRHRDDPRCWAHFELPANAAPEQVWVGSVASSAENDNLRRWCRDHGYPAPRFVQVAKTCLGLTVAYDETEKLGVDRWLALLGARASVDGAVCGADAGTAITLDAADASGRHLGGLIAPGPETMARSLLRGTARIGEAARDAVDSPFAADTGDAVRAGALYANAALIERFARETEARLNGAATLFLTGGARHDIAPLLRVAARDEPDLVLHGLLALADADGSEE